MHGHMNINFKVRLLIVYKFYKCNWYTEYWTHYSTHYRVEKPTIYSRLDPDEYILQRILLFVKLRFNIILSVRPSFPSSLFLSDTCRSSWHHKHTHTHTYTYTNTRPCALTSFSSFFFILPKKDVYQVYPWRRYFHTRPHGVNVQMTTNWKLLTDMVAAPIDFPGYIYRGITLCVCVCVCVCTYI